MIALFGSGSARLGDFYPKTWLYPNLSTLNIAHSTIFTLSNGFLDCMEFLRNLSRDIDITNGQVDQVDKRIHSSKSAGTILHNADDPIETFRDGIG
jgi:hypothetical protein